MAILPYAVARLVGVYNVDLMTRFSQQNPLDSVLLLVGATWFAAYAIASHRGFRIAIAASVIAVGYFGYRTVGAIETHRRDLGLLSATEQSSSSDVVLIDRFEGHSGPVKWVEFDPTGELAVSSSGWPEGDRTVRLWDIESRELLWLRRMPSGSAMTATFTPDGKQVVAGNRDGTVTLWDTDTARKIRQWYATDELQAIDVLPDGKRCLVAGRQVRLRDLQTGGLIKEFVGFRERRLDLTLSGDGKRLASCGFGGDVIVWDFETGDVISKVNGIGNQTESISLNHDGSRAVVGSDSSREDRRLVTLDVNSGTLQQSFLGHERTVNWVRYLREDKWIVSGSRDQTVRLWEASTGAEIDVLRAHNDWVWAAAPSSNADLLLTGGGGVAFDNPGTDYALRLWDLRRLQSR